MACDIKQYDQAFNDGNEAFEKAMLQSGGKNPSKALSFAISEVKRLYPDIDFEPSSLVEPIVAHYKKEGILSDKFQYKYEGNAKGLNINKLTEKLKIADPTKRKKFIDNVFKKISEDGNVSERDFINFFAEATGLPHTDAKFNEVAATMAKSLQNNKAIDNEVVQTIKDMQAEKAAATTQEQKDAIDKEYQKKFDALEDRVEEARNKSAEAAYNMAKLTMEKRFWLHNYSTFMTLNLLGPKSLIKNITGAVVDLSYRGLTNTINNTTDYIYSLFSKNKSSKFGSRARGTDFKKVAGKGKRAWKYNLVDFQNELPTMSFSSAAEDFERVSRSAGTWDNIKNILAGTYKVFPETISKMLTAPDAIFYEMAYDAELSRIAEAKGLKGAEKQAFMLKPDENSKVKATAVAKKSTFKDDVNPIVSSIASYDPHTASKALQQKGWNPKQADLATGLRAVVQKAVVPFVKTPWNMVKLGMRMSMPEYVVSETIYKSTKAASGKERQEIITKGLAEAMVGYHVRAVLIQAVAMGLVSAGYNDEDPKTKDAIDQSLGGPNRMNISAILRGLFFQDMSPKENDVKVDISALGVTGLMAGMYAHTFSKDARTQEQEQQDYNKMLLKAIDPRTGVITGMQSLGASLDFTFMTGLNEIQKALKDPDKALDKYLINLFATMATGIMPSTVQKVGTSAEPEVKQLYDKDKDFTENLLNRFGYSFGFGVNAENLKNKYYGLAPEGQSAVKKKNYIFIDSRMGRLLADEFDFGNLQLQDGEDNPIKRLYDETRKLKKDDREKLFPANVGKTIGIQDRRNDRTVTDQVELTDEQHQYLMDRAGFWRTVYATPYIKSPDWNTSSFESKANILQSYYKEGLKQAISELKGRYPNIKDQVVQSSERSKEDKKSDKEIFNRYLIKQ